MARKINRKTILRYRNGVATLIAMRIAGSTSDAQSSYPALGYVREL
jgi:hypothetical protein